MTKVFYESEVQVKERKTTWQKSFKEGQKTEDELVQQTAELLAATRMDKGTKAELQDCFDSWARRCDEAEAARSKKSLAEDGLKQCFERHKTSWEPAARKTDVIAEKAWQLSQNNNT